MSTRGRRNEPSAAGLWLRDQRERRGITTQAELARRLGWDKTMVNNYETRGVEVPNERAEQLAEFFGIDIITVRRNLGLWVPDDEPPADPMGAAEAILDDSERIAARLKELNRRDREVVESALDALIRALKSAAEKPEVEDNNHR